MPSEDVLEAAVLRRNFLRFVVIDRSRDVVDPLLYETLSCSGTLRVTGAFRRLLFVIFRRLILVALAHQLRRDEPRVVVARELLVRDRALGMFGMNADLHEVLAAGTAKHCRAHRAVASMTAFCPVGDKRAALRIHAEADVIDAVEERVQLGTQEGRLLLAAEASDQ
jgi:hypothetical protein